MDYKQALVKLNAFLRTVERYRGHGDSADLHKVLCVQYGQVEEIIERVIGTYDVLAPVHGLHEPAHYRNYIEAGFLAQTTSYGFTGYTQLLKVIGRVRQLVQDPSGLPEPQSVTRVVQILRRFPECCQYVKKPPGNEKAVKDLLWIMLRSNFDRVDRENTLPRFGGKGLHPRFRDP